MPAKKNKICLIQPFLRDFYQTSSRTMPLGLACLAGALRAAGFETIIIDALAGESKITLSIPREISYLKDYYRPGNLSPFKLFGHFYHFGLTPEELKKKIIKSGARIFGITANFTAYYQEAREVARLIKSIDPRNLVIMGGAHPTAFPKETLSEPAVDAMVLGEGEIRLPVLIKNIVKKNYPGLKMIDGIGYKKSGTIIIQPLKKYIGNLDKLARPALELLDLSQYKIGGRPAVPLFTSRGCPHRCTFCTVSQVWGRNFRAQSAERVLSEIKYAFKKFGIRSFNFEDDNFTFDKKRAEKIMDLIIKNFGPRQLQLLAMNGLETSHLDRELLKKMWQAGFSELNLSVVSLSDRTGRHLRRPFGRRQFQSIYKTARNLGFKITAYIIIGLPGQTKTEIINTIKELARLEVLIGPSFFYPPPGTDFFKKYFQYQKISSFRSSCLPVETEQINRLELITFFRIIRMVNFIKELRIKNIDPQKFAADGYLKSILWQTDGTGIINDKNLSPEEISRICLGLYFKKNLFFGLKKIGQRRYRVWPEKSADYVCSSFLSPVSI